MALSFFQIPDKAFMNIFIFHQSSEFLASLSEIIGFEIEAKIQTSTYFNELELSLEIESFELVIIEHTRSNNSLIQTLFKKNKPKCFTLFVSSKPSLLKDNQTALSNESMLIDSTFGPQFVIESILDCLKKIMIGPEAQSFIPVSVTRLYLANELPCAVYYKNGDNYSIYLSKEEKISLEDYFLNSNNNLYSLYIKEENKELFFQKSNQSSKQFTAKDITLIGQISLKKTMETLSRRKEFDAKSLKMAKEISQSIINNISHDGQLREGLIESLLNLNYINMHSTLLVIFMTILFQKDESLGQENLEKLSYAAILHDLLINDEDLAKIDKLDKKTIKELKPEEVTKVLSHPTKLASIIAESEIVSKDVSIIIRTHHERFDGSGFPKRISWSEMNKLSRIFILTHEMVDEFINKMNQQETLEAITQKLYHKYEGIGDLERTSSLYKDYFKRTS